MIDRSTNIREALKKRQRGFIINPFRFGGGVDFSTVSLLLHFDGANGSTTFTDSSSNALTLVASGDAAITTAQSKFGGSAFGNTTGKVSCSTLTPFYFGNGEFTVECHAYLGTAPSAEILFAALWGGTPGAYKLSWAFGVNSSRRVILYHSLNGTTAAGYFAAGGGVVGLSGWHHVAVCRYDGKFQAWIDGVSAGSTTSNVGTNSLSSPTGMDFTVGGQWNSSASTLGAGRYVDELRITKGVARYKSAFTPPTAAFPNS